MMKYKVEAIKRKGIFKIYYYYFMRNTDKMVIIKIRI